jgi:sialidase-1
MAIKFIGDNFMTRWRKILVLSGILTATCLFFGGVAGGQPVRENILWKSGEGNYRGYRIPSVILTNNGTLLAFAEGRNGGGDSGNIDLVMKRSADNGKTWSEEQVVWDDSLNTCGNPCPVVDVLTGRIWLFMTWNLGKDHENDIIRKTSASTRLPYVCYSDTDGLTWSAPIQIAGSCKDAQWGWYATGPGVGIQLKTGRYKGRLVIPANHSYDDPGSLIRKDPFGYGSHVLISDDQGKTWHKSAPIRPACNESQVAELSDGTLLLNMRSYTGKQSRALSFSTDGGETWSTTRQDFQLVESVCQASLISYGEYQGHSVFLFSNPAVPVGRTHMTIRYSLDDCRSWTASKLIYAGPSGYSCLVKLRNSQVGLLFEKGTKSSFDMISFVRMDLRDLLGKADIQIKYQEQP